MLMHHIESSQERDYERRTSENAKCRTVVRHSKSGAAGVAGRERFELSRVFEALLVFETSTFNRSVTSPFANPRHYTQGGGSWQAGKRQSARCACSAIGNSQTLLALLPMARSVIAYCLLATA